MRRWFACAARSINTLIVTHTKKILSMHVPCLTNLYQSTDSHPSQKDRGEWTRGHFPLLASWNLRNSSVPHGICAYLKRRRVFSRLDNVRTQLPSEARALAKVLEGKLKELEGLTGEDSEGIWDSQENITPGYPSKSMWERGQGRSQILSKGVLVIRRARVWGI